jgi:DNA invertase Pin-like site-specific DNA recombinase
MPTTIPKMVAYYRVSTRKQGQSGLGLEAQRMAVTKYAGEKGGQIVAEYTEVETGKRADRPTLQEALGHAKLSGATLVIAKLDRLARNVRFTAELMESGVEFVACDNPNANKLTIQILAAVAEDEARRTSQRTTQALEAAKARGVKLGSARPGHWEGREHRRGWAKATTVAAERRVRKAKEAYDFLLPAIRRMRASGDTYQGIADWLNQQGHRTMAKKPFTPTAVWRVLRRADKAP